MSSEQHQCAYGCETQLVEQERTFKNGTKHIEKRCPTCGRGHGYAPKNINPLEFIMPFGKHIGLPLGEIAKRDRPYLEWARANFKRANIVSRINAVLAGQQ